MAYLDYKNWYIEALCLGSNTEYGCGSLLKVESEDIKVTLDKNLNLYYTFKCPCCNIENVVFEYLIPSKIRINSLRNLKYSLRSKLNERYKF